MATSAPPVLRVAGPLARAAAGAVRHPTVRAAADAALRRLEPAALGKPGARGPLTPAAVRVERARWRRGEERADQTAVTVWFGEGPSLPAPGGSNALRGAIRLGSGVLGAAALAALTAIAARREESRTKVVDAPTPAVPIP